MRSTTAAALVVIGLVTGCSSEDKAASNKPTVPIAPLQSATTPTAPGSDQTADAALKYMQALATQVPETMRSALEVAEPGSPPEGYALFRIEGQEAARSAGQAGAGAVTVTAQPDGTITQTRPDGAGAVTFGGFKSSPAGKLTEISGNGQDLRSRLAKPSAQPVAAFDAKLSVAAGLQSADAGALLLVLQVETGAKPLEVQISASSYTGADGQVHNPEPKQSSFDKATITPGSTARVIVAVPGAAPGGRFVASIAAEGSEPEKPELPVLSY